MREEKRKSRSFGSFLITMGYKKETTDARPQCQASIVYLFVGYRSGINRAKIIGLLKEYPYNVNQLAEALKVDYEAIQRHISVLKKNNIVSKTGEKYGVLYSISNFL